MVKRIVALGVFLIIVIGLFSGCGNDNKYNAVLYSDATVWMHEDFLIENLTRDAVYDGIPLDDPLYPKNITHLIQSKEDFDKVFTEFPTELDFEKEMLCIYIFSCNYMGLSYEISEMSLEDNMLKIEVNFVMPGFGASGSATVPKQRCLAVKIDRLDIETVEFSEK
ncbi:MAG: hypothetical protein WDA65_08490 [Christensenellales bacterium]